MNKISVALSSLGVCLLLSAPAAAGTADITGLNSWQTVWGTSFPIYASNATNHTPSGNASLLIEPLGNPPGSSNPERDFAFTFPGSATEITRIDYWEYIPSAPVTPIFCYGFGTNPNTPGGFYGCEYIENPGDGWSAVWGGGGGGGIHPRENWNHVQYVIDPVGGTMGMYVNGSGGSGPTGPESTDAFWFSTGDWVQAQSIPLGPLYIDDITVTVGNSVIWSDNFDSYIQVQPPVSGDIPEPATLALLGLAGAGLGGYIRRRRRA